MRKNWVLPVMISVAFFALAWALPSISPHVEHIWRYCIAAVGFAILVISYFIARNVPAEPLPQGGRGGEASAPGEGAEAVGGAGGNANGRLGGDGGSAVAAGKRSRAKGGAGGSG